MNIVARTRDLLVNPGPSSIDVVQCYRSILGREPEGDAVIQEHRRRGSLAAVIHALLGSYEYASRQSLQTPKHDTIDSQSILRRHAVENRQFVPGFITNFIGVETNVRCCGWVNEGVEDSLPVPGNFHATAFEWAAALRAQDLARESFTVIELGAGWGCWMVNTAIPAKRRGLKVLAIGVEGDEDHVGYMERHCVHNGLDPREFRADRSIAWAQSGVAVFPRSEDASAAYGQEPKFFLTREEAQAFINAANAPFDILTAKTLADISADLARVDLLHIDVQGGESDLIKASLPLLHSKVAYIVVGTHGRRIEGEIIAALEGDGWVLEIEEPCTLPKPLTSGLRYIDGVQGWRNPHIT